MQDCTQQRHRVVQLQVAIIVPGQRTDAIARLNAQSLERIGQPVDAPYQVSVRVAVDAGLALGHYFFGAEEAFEAPEDVMQRQRIVLHQTLDRGPWGCRPPMRSLSTNKRSKRSPAATTKSLWVHRCRRRTDPLPIRVVAA